jgi:hypothetical protein
MPNEEAAQELESLIAECKQNATRSHARGRFYYYLGYSIMILSVMGSIGAGALALATNVDRALVGIIALVPAFCATVAGQLRLVEKSNWFYRRKRELDAFARKATVARRRRPDLETLEACYAELDALDRAMGDEWSDKLAFDFTAHRRREPA